MFDYIVCKLLNDYVHKDWAQRIQSIQGKSPDQLTAQDKQDIAQMMALQQKLGGSSTVMEVSKEGTDLGNVFHAAIHIKIENNHDE